LGVYLVGRKLIVCDGAWVFPEMEIVVKPEQNEEAQERKL
jgi:hypothetical protein